MGDELVAELGDQAVGRERRHRRERRLPVRRRPRASTLRRRCPARAASDRKRPRSVSAGRRRRPVDRGARRRRHRPAASAGCTCWPGGTSTIPTPAARSCTPTSSCAGGRRPGSTSSTARRPPRAGRPTARRHGYQVVRRGSRYSVFPRTTAAELAGRMGRSDALIEIWNGVPWFSPVWYRRPAHDDPPPRPRPDVGPDHAAAAGRRRPLPGGPAGAAVLPRDADGDAVGGDPPGAARARLPTRRW